MGGNGQKSSKASTETFGLGDLESCFSIKMKKIMQTEERCPKGHDITGLGQLPRQDFESPHRVPTVDNRGRNKSVIKLKQKYPYRVILAQN